MRERVSADLYKDQIPVFKTDDPDINKGWQLAVHDMLYNIGLFKDGILEEKVPVLLAGGGYDTPWTRDAAINTTWNAAGILIPDVAKNTLLSVLMEENGKRRIGGQYWDAVIWTIGAWQYYLYTGDAAFLPLIKEATENSLAYFEKTEWDKEKGLFNGPACYGDGIAAYPDRYVNVGGGILGYPDYYLKDVPHRGVGIPLCALSTNCLYAECYRLAFVMTGKEEYRAKHDSLKARINEVFWNEERGLYDYAIDDVAREERQEALGESFAIMFGIADEEKKKKILENCNISPNGITCLYPTYERYLPYGLGRHSGTVWPFAQAFFADAAARIRPDKAAFELKTLTKNALATDQFYEIYHPETGEPYGGVQETDGPMSDKWKSIDHQTWSATGYLRMLLLDLAGLNYTEEGLSIRPVRIADVKTLTIEGLKYRNAVLNITIGEDGWEKGAWVPANAEGTYNVKL